MTSKFNSLYESIGAIKTTTRQFYPRNFTFSENFLNAFKEEYENQRKSFNENNVGKPFQPYSEKILKALRFEMRSLDEMSQQSQQAISQKMGPKMTSDTEIITSEPKQPSSKKFKNLKLRKQ